MGPVGEAVSGPLLLGLPLALLAGFVSFASPCVLPLVPGYLAYIGGFTDGRSQADRADRRGRARLGAGVGLFVLGFAVVFVVFGILSAAAGFWLLQWRDLVTRLAGIVVILLGVVFAGWLPLFQRTLRTRFEPVAGLAGAPLLGAVFAIGWTPCLGPTLTAINAMSFQEGSLGHGAILGFAYAVGLGIPFVLVALGFGWATRTVGFLRRHIRAINIAGGVLLVLIGLLMVSGLWNTWIAALGTVIADYGTLL